MKLIIELSIKEGELNQIGELIQISIKQSLVKYEDQKTYQSGVGYLLYLVRNSRLDISNPIIQLCKSMDLSNEDRLNKILRFNSKNHQNLNSFDFSNETVALDAEVIQAFQAPPIPVFQ